MDRRSALRTLAGAGAVALAGCTVGTGTDRSFTDGFEDALTWRRGAAIGPEVAIEDFRWRITPTSQAAHGGDRSLRVFTGGEFDDGVAWVTHPIPVRAGRAYTAEASVQAWSESESFNTLRNLVFALSPERPTVEEDFPAPGETSTGAGVVPTGGLREALHLKEGWREYAFTWKTPELDTETLWLSVGVAVVWEADAVHYLDDVALTLTPR